MEDSKVQWERGENNITIVTLPDGSKITVNDLVAKLGIGKQSAYQRIKRYIKNGCLEDLWKEKNCRKVHSKKKKATIKNKRLRYEEGDYKQAYCYWFHLALTGKQNKLKYE